MKTKIKPMVKLKILMIGSLPPPLGGVTVLTKQLVFDLKNLDDVDLFFIDLSTPTGSKMQRLAVFIKSIILLFYRIFWADVLVVGTRVPFELFYGILAMPFLKIKHKPLVIRKFAGNFDTRYKEVAIYKWFYEKILFRADLWLFETKYLVELFRDKIKNVQWFSNNRSSKCVVARPHQEAECRKFVYLGQVRPHKGIQQLLEAASHLKSNISVDVYGPFFDGLSERDLTDKKNVKYKGIVKPDEVISTLSKYDAMILPTRWNAEGYPGAILEAYFAGIPVIASKIGAIPEIVNTNCGILIKPDDATDLRKAMEKIIEDDDLYARLCNGVLKTRKNYFSERWAVQLVQHCKELIENQSH